MKLIRCMIIILLVGLLLTPLVSIAEEEGEETIMFNNSDLKKSLPRSYDIALAAEKALANDTDFNEQYFEAQAFYAKAIWQMLIDRCDIMGLDKKVAESDLHFNMTDSPVNVYQKHWNFGAGYFFLRNNIHIERLGKADLERLQRFQASVGVADTELQAFIWDTLPVVISVDPDQNEENIDFVYEMDGKMAPNFAIVLGMSTMPSYNDDGDYVDAQAEATKEKAIASMIEQAEAIMSEALGIPVRIFTYLF